MTPLVLVFLRGGADGLALVPPRDPRLRALRPTLHREGAAPLDDRFALHPALAPLRPYWDAGRLALVHAIGSGDATRSHFEAQDRMERGDGASGWLARWAPRSASPLARVALGPHLPEALRGARATVFERAEEAGLESAPFTAALRALHGGGDPLARAGAAALAALDRLAALPPAPPGFPATPLGQRLAEAARLVRAGVGLEVACVDH
ncbi:MAG TPA: hypothetical protein RMG95_01980, partial [Polyangiaceae bacterium LLY-WYZ-15_(1-7)]|nr:hypothetical protein [Polyangiaceae bacterium LLY-WYZ-15_(1-7)]